MIECEWMGYIGMENPPLRPSVVGLEGTSQAT